MTYVGVAGGTISFGMTSGPDRAATRTRRRATRPGTLTVLGGGAAEPVRR